MYKTVLSLTALAASVYAQTFTNCNPLETTCNADPALGTTFGQAYNSTTSLSPDYWNITGAPAPSFPSDNSGAAFVISSEGEAPLIVTPFYIFWGHVEVIMRAASGQGIISSIVLLSDDLDEIDWEVMGGNSSSVENNYYGKGDSSQRNALYYPCDNPQGGFHNYTVNWSSEQIDWILDGTVVRTLKASDAVLPNGTTMYPQTPMQLKIGNWAGGDPKNAPGTIAWAGGKTTYGDTPYTMTVQSVKVIDGTTNVTQYTYGDHSGTWQSIKTEEGESAVSQKINAPQQLTISQTWSNLSRGAQIAVVCVIAGVSAGLLLVLTFFCIKQRRAGKMEHAQAETQWTKEQVELLEYKRMWPGYGGGPAYGGGPGYGGGPAYGGGMYDKTPSAMARERY